MAIPQVIMAPADGEVIHASELIWRRIPDRLFAPLSSPNKRRYWRIIHRLYMDRFGPDAPVPPAQGFSQSVIMRDIDSELTNMDAWEVEREDEVAESAHDARASQVFARLRECGWLRVERYGVRDMVSMRREVTQFITQLNDFATKEPVFLAGKVRTIEHHLKLILEGQASGDSLGEAAAEARRLLEHIRNTGTDIHDLISAISGDISTSQYVRKFFTGFIETKFIGDYGELRTREHPLSRRAEIIRLVEEFQLNPVYRTRLIEWYATKRFASEPDGDQKALRTFDRDIGRLLEFDRVDEYLERLDDEIRRANKRAIAFLDYRLRSAQPLDKLIAQAITNVIANPAAASNAPFADGAMICGERLAQPRKTRPKQPPSALRKVVVSIEEKARASLRNKAREARTINAYKLTSFVMRHLGDTSASQSADMEARSITDIRAMQTLHSLSLNLHSGSRKLAIDAKKLIHGYRIKRTGNEETSGAYLSGVPFEVERNQAPSTRREGSQP